ncbi:radical SAM protein [Sorangium sp. So ce388]|uniref:radical SAM protein n=1 Tax=Sorangium sp. So ce388 TaxID=3133309 RepID=UPI003F5B910C
MLNAEQLRGIAERAGVPFTDTLLIAANMEGARAQRPFPRARMRLRPVAQDEIWQLILPLDNDDSPFELNAGRLLLSGEPVADLMAVENDDVVLTYLRAGGRSLTLNTHSRSTCVGCIFCPNIIEDAADATIDGASALEKLLRWVCADNGWKSLEHVEIITICSGCFNAAEAAVRHLSDLRSASRQLGFAGRLHLLSSVVRERRHLEELGRHAGPFHLTLTLECFDRRQTLLKSTKASLEPDQACRILDDCAEIGIVGDFTYVAGLDPIEVALDGLLRLSRHVTTFPRVQVYQAHNEYMRRYRDPGAARIDYYLRLREQLERPLAKSGLRPRSWENYRPLWYTQFDGGPVEGPRI